LFQVDRKSNYEIRFNDEQSSLRYWDVKNYLPLLLNRADTMCMANSIEARPFFLDSDLADFALSKSERSFTTFRHTKLWLRELASQYFDTKLAYSPKLGFPLPTEFWFKFSLRDYIFEFLSNKNLNLYSLVPRKDVLEALHTPYRGSRLDTECIYRILSVAIWMESQRS
jgi:asparagine synthase (glutamine-hydrolysing)